MASKQYRKLKGTTGIYKHKVSGHYYAEKRVKGVLLTNTFTHLHQAKAWREGKLEITDDLNSDFSTLKDVWEAMQEHHFPILATSTKNMWRRRYTLLAGLEHYPMDKITPSKITEWVMYWVEHFKNADHEERGKARRCNLNNELNLFVTIFNWYKESEIFEEEAKSLTNPIKKKHRKMGFIRPLPDKKMQIDLKDALIFFDYLKPLYRDLAQMQFFTAGRIGEVSGMQWSNINLKERRMLIKHTCVWDMVNKTFLELKEFPKNREPRPVYITDEIMDILERRLAFRMPGNDYVFHVEGNPLNYGTIQLNYREAQRKGKLPYSGTHILRHGMAKLARKVGGGLDAVIAITGHKDLKLADHYSKCNEDDQREVSQMIMKHIRAVKNEHPNEPDSGSTEHENVIDFQSFKNGTNS